MYFEEIIVMKKILISCFTIISLSVNSQDFIVREGNKLTVGKGGPEIYLRGICFGNLVWDNIAIPINHHSEIDFKRVKSMGMNTVRFYMNYRTFENESAPYQYKQTGWDWIDKNIAWAKTQGVYLILNIHVPQGGFQSQCKGEALWTNAENQNRVVALWKAIAQRYHNEPQIAGYDLINEPTPKASATQWNSLAQRLIDSIRTVDKNHLLISERAIAVNCDYSSNDGNFNFPILKEDNLMYTVHFYEPYTFTHQLQDWAGTGEGGKYPDENVVMAPADASFAIGNYSNPSLPSGTTDWTYSKGKPYLVLSDTLFIGRPVFYGHQLSTGVAYYDDITVNEVDRLGNVIRQIARDSFSLKPNIWFWSEKNDGNMGTSTSGHGDDFSITNTGTSGYSSITCPDFTFKAEKGKYYAINGWIKGTDIPDGATVSISTEFSYSPSRSPVQTRNKDFLRKAILHYSQYPREHNYPVYFGEFGLSRACYENGRGGANWTKDMMDIFDSLGYHFTYHDYHEDGFGLYTGWNSPIDSSTVNQDLKKTFEDFFLGNPTGLEEEKAMLNDIVLFPNPSTTGFKLSRIPYGAEIKVADALGNTIYQGVGTEFGTNWPKGLYFCQLKWNNLEKSFKAVKQ